MISDSKLYARLIPLSRQTLTNVSGDVGWIVVENFFCILWISEMVLKMKTLPFVQQ
jgi:hypothetical protein